MQADHLALLHLLGQVAAMGFEALLRALLGCGAGAEVVEHRRLLDVALSMDSGKRGNLIVVSAAA
jgi:hypothetical protein